MTSQDFLDTVPFKDGDKCFIIVQRQDENSDRLISQRLCVGFNSFELLGVLTDLQLSVHSQINGTEPHATCISKEWKE